MSNPITRKSPVVLEVSLLALSVFSPTLAGDREFTRQELTEDTRQLVDAIESAHPDPYLRGGGKVAFHRRFQELLESIPDHGLVLSQFVDRLQPFVCAIGDGHTAVRAGDSPDLLEPDPGLPFVFGVVQDWLYVRGVYDPEHEKLIGARLVSVEGVPSATETFRELVLAMKAASAKTLVVDLRDNTGGNSLMKEILAYFLYGQDALDSLDSGYQIVKYSDLYYSVYAADNLEKVNAGRRTALTRGDYDFKEERARHKGVRKGGWLEAVRDSTTFMKEYRTGVYHTPVYRPEAVFVLSTPLTYSSGFNMLRDLYALGAIVVGTPSAQPGNNFGDSLPFKLKHTGLSVFVSHKQNLSFPNEPERGTCLMPHHLLTYEELSALSFDPNAELLLALDLAKAGRSPDARP